MHFLKFKTDTMNYLLPAICFLLLFLHPAAGHAQPDLQAGASQGMNDRWIGIPANYSLHYVGDFPDNTISADYFGETGLQLKRQSPDINYFTICLANAYVG